MADAYAQVGAKDEALRWLRHAVESGFFQPTVTQHSDTLEVPVASAPSDTAPTRQRR